MRSSVPNGNGRAMDFSPPDRGGVPDDWDHDPGDADDVQDDWEALDDTSPSAGSPSSSGRKASSSKPPEPEPVAAPVVEAPIRAKKKKALIMKNCDAVETGNILDAYKDAVPKAKVTIPVVKPEPKKTLSVAKKPKAKMEEEVDNWEDISDQKITAKIEKAETELGSKHVFTVPMLLKYSPLVWEEERVPPELVTFRSIDEKALAVQKKGRGKGGKDGKEAGNDRGADWREGRNNDEKAGSWRLRKQDPRLERSENAYVVSGAKSREDALFRALSALMNKITPETFDSLTEQLAQVVITSASDLNSVIDRIFEKALLEHQYCELYADLCCKLRTRYPEFPSEDPGQPTLTFTRALLNRCQEEFESLPTTLKPVPEQREKYRDDPEGLEMIIKKVKDRVLGNMKFIGQLYLRRLLSHKVVKEVVFKLVFSKDVPEEHFIECLCTLMKNIGAALESTEAGKQHMTDYASRMAELLSMDYPKRIQFQIRDVLDLRDVGWQERRHTLQAKTKEEVRRDAKREQKAKDLGADNPFVQTQIAGARPQHIREQMEAEASRQRERSSKSSEGTTRRRDTSEDSLGKVRKMLQYFQEDGDLKCVETDWQRAAIPERDVSKVVKDLLELGFNDSRRAESVARFVVGLVRLGCVSMAVLVDSITEFTSNLEDILVDNPRADAFYQQVVAYLLLNPGKERFDPRVFEGLAKSSASFKLLCGVLGLVKSHKGLKALKLSLQEMMHFLLAMIGTEDRKVLHDLLVKDGVLVDPLKEVMPRLQEILRRQDFSVESISCQLRESFGAQVEAVEASEMFFLQLFTELLSVLKKDDSRSWQQKIEKARELLAYFSSRCPAGPSPYARQGIMLDALMNATLLTPHLSDDDLHAILRSLCETLLITAQDLQRWCEDPLTQLDDSAERRRMVPIAEAALKALRHEDGDISGEDDR